MPRSPGASPASTSKDHARTRAAQINVRCTVEERTRIVAGGAAAWAKENGDRHWPPFSFSDWARKTLLAAATAALPSAKAKAKAPAKKKARRR